MERCWDGGVLGCEDVGLVGRSSGGIFQDVYHQEQHAGDKAFKQKNTQNLIYLI